MICLPSQCSPLLSDSALANRFGFWIILDICFAKITDVVVFFYLHLFLPFSPTLPCTHNSKILNVFFCFFLSSGFTLCAIVWFYFYTRKNYGCHFQHAFPPLIPKFHCLTIAASLCFAIFFRIFYLVIVQLLVQRIPHLFVSFIYRESGQYDATRDDQHLAGCKVIEFTRSSWENENTHSKVSRFLFFRVSCSSFRCRLLKNEHTQEWNISLLEIGKKCFFFHLW